MIEYMSKLSYPPKSTVCKFRTVQTEEVYHG